ncbi:kinase-like domain-containing protein [Amylostereum chailletii]|nr:kinase-like domain-containing protein [Amylostereum chailletii]
MATILTPPPSPALSNSTRDNSPSPPSIFSFQSASSASSAPSPSPNAACLPTFSYPENVSYPSGLSFLLEEGHITPLVPSSVSSVSTVYTQSFLSEYTPPTPVYASRKADGSFTRKLSGADFEVLKPLGNGSFGKVFLARDIHTGVSVAIKAMEKSLLREEGMTPKEMHEEQEIMMGLRGQDGQLQLLGSWHDKAYFYLVTLQEVCIGELTRVVFDTKSVTVYAAEILLALDTLHAQGIIHHDIKTDNVLIDQRGHAILADFGLAEKVAAAGGFSTRHCGTVQYLSPEVVRGQRFSYEADIWSFGVMLYVMLTGKMCPAHCPICSARSRKHAAPFRRQHR